MLWQERLRIYTDGVKTLEIDEHSPTDVTIVRVLQQYGAVNEMHWSILDAEVHVAELYSFKDRQVVIRGSQSVPDFMDSILIPTCTDEKDGLQHLETRSIGSRGQRLNEEKGKVVLDWLVNVIGKGKGGTTWLTDLTQLELSSVTFSLKSLETVLVGCPNLEVLGCSVDTSGMSNDERKAFHNDLRQVFKKGEATIKELDFRHIGGGEGIMQWLDALIGPPMLRLSGIMDRFDPEVLEHIVTRGPSEARRERLTRQLILSLRDVPIEEVNPYVAAKVLRWALSDFCDIQVETPEDGTPAATKPNVWSWVKQFRSILETLQREDDIKRKTSMSKGWKEMQKVPDGGDAREASGSGPVKNAPDGSDVNTASGGGDTDSAPTNSGVDSTGGGGNEPSLWYVSFSKTDVPRTI